PALDHLGHQAHELGRGGVEQAADLSEAGLQGLAHRLLPQPVWEHVFDGSRPPRQKRKRRKKKPSQFPAEQDPVAALLPVPDAGPSSARSWTGHSRLAKACASGSDRSVTASSRGSPPRPTTAGAANAASAIGVHTRPAPS